MRAFLTSKTRQGSHVGGMYGIPRASMSEQEVEDTKKTLTLQAKNTFGVPPPPLKAYEEDETTLYVPRFFGLQRFGAAEHDYRSDGKPIDLTFHGTLTELQERAKGAVIGGFMHSANATNGSIVVLPCGKGKTVFAIKVISELKRKACVLVHKECLKDQWVERIQHFCPTARIGTIQGNTCDVEDKDIVIAMVLTMCKRTFPKELLDQFGTVFADEAHHYAAPVLNLALRCFNARHICGLTATKERVDGLTPLLDWSLGPEAFRAERDDEPVKVSMCLYTNPNAKEISGRNGKPLVSIMVNHLARDPYRNKLLANRIATYYHSQRTIIVLSDRIDQIKALQLLLSRSHNIPEERIGEFTGPTHRRDRSEHLSRTIVLTTYQMANEGLDKKELDCLVMGTPKSNVVQCIGRIQRPNAEKKEPLVFDLVDTYSVFANMRWKRQALYRKEKYEIQTVGLEAAMDDGYDGWFK